MSLTKLELGKWHQCMGTEKPLTFFYSVFSLSLCLPCSWRGRACAGPRPGPRGRVSGPWWAGRYARAPRGWSWTAGRPASRGLNKGQSHGTLLCHFYRSWYFDKKRTRVFPKKVKWHHKIYDKVNKRDYQAILYMGWQNTKLIFNESNVLIQI